MLPMTESRLRSRRYQKAMTLLAASDVYRSRIDMLLGALSPAWKKSIMDYYDGSGPQLADQASQDAIDRIDQVLDGVLVDLAKSRSYLSRHNMLGKSSVPDQVLQKMVTATVRSFITPLFPQVPNTYRTCGTFTETLREEEHQ